MTDAGTTRMPAVFVGHGSPMNTLEHNRFTQAWHDFGRSIPAPRAILAVSAHWYVNATAVTAMAVPRTIHDFGGFPQALFDVQYPAPGDPELAAHVAELLAPVAVHQDGSQWGLDHGTWSVLAHMFPDADVPVVQLAIDAGKSFAEHLALGAALAPLRDEGVLILGSGNVVHNLRIIDWSTPDDAAPWAHEFDGSIRDLMTARPRGVVDAESLTHYATAAPTPDHFIPLLYVAGLADAAATTTDVLVGGYAYGSLSMTSYVLAA